MRTPGRGFKITANISFSAGETSELSMLDCGLDAAKAALFGLPWAKARDDTLQEFEVGEKVALRSRALGYNWSQNGYQKGKFRRDEMP